MKWVGFLVALVLMVPAVLGLMARERSLAESRERVVQLEADIARLTSDLELGREWARALESESWAIEQVAREKLGYVKEGEWVFRLETPGVTDVSD